MSPLALFGGPPVRRTPFPAWPVFDAAEEAAVLRTLRSGTWGRLDGGGLVRLYAAQSAHRRDA